MEIKKTQSGLTCELTLTGRLDVVTAPALQGALAEALSSAAKTQLDLSAVDYVSSAGLRVLLLGEKNAKSAGKTMTIRNVNPEVMEVFRITGFSDVLTFD